MTNRTFNIENPIVKTHCVLLVFTILQSGTKTTYNKHDSIVKTKSGSL